MANRDVYAHGLLNRALDPATQPEAVRDFLRSEETLLARLVPSGASVVDFGCGTGRHLHGLGSRISMGVGLDYEPSYVIEARRLRGVGHLHFLVGDGRAAPLSAAFDRAVCLTSTWGTMTDKMTVLEEMKRLAPKPRTRLITAYSTASIPARREWYARLGHEVTDVTDEHIVAGGFISEHFSDARLRSLLGDCVLHPLGAIGFLAEV